jgi:hypothetical protein
LSQIVKVDPVKHAATLVRNAQLVEAVPQRTRQESVAHRGSAVSWRETIREGWKHWITLNANNLAWSALVIGGFLLTTLLM